MIVILLLKIFNPILLISTPSIIIFPFSNSIILNNVKDKVDFPLPVLPTIPIFSLLFIEKEIFFNIKSK